MIQIDSFFSKKKKKKKISHENTIDPKVSKKFKNEIDDEIFRRTSIDISGKETKCNSKLNFCTKDNLENRKINKKFRCKKSENNENNEKISYPFVRGIF